MKITVYATTTCPYCKMVKEYLTAKNLFFVEKLIDQDETIKSEMMRVSDGYLGVPFTVVEKDNGEVKKIVGFDQKLFDEVLKEV
jgi:glutaredoxin